MAAINIIRRTTPIRHDIHPLIAIAGGRRSSVTLASSGTANHIRRHIEATERRSRKSDVHDDFASSMRHSGLLRILKASGDNFLICLARLSSAILIVVEEVP
jgi:hypothetical protein